MGLAFWNPFMISVRKTNNFAALFALNFLLVLLLSKEGAAVDCQLIGIWGNWEAWSSCPANPPIPLLNIRRRLRDCIPQPPNCVETTQYNCNGPYSEVENCVSTTLAPSTSTTTAAPTTTIAVTTTSLPTTTTTAVPITSTTTTSLPITTTTTPLPTTTTTTTTTVSATTTTTTPIPTTTTTRLPTTTTAVPTTTTATAVPTTVTLTQLITTTVSALFTTTTAPGTTTTIAGDPACAGTQWNTWLEWSTCTDPCGSCGTHQRLRACTKSATTCRCPGSAIEKTVCITEVCKYPRETPCCDGYSPFSQDGQFLCILNSTLSQQGKR